MKKGRLEDANLKYSLYFLLSISYENNIKANLSEIMPYFYELFYYAIKVVYFPNRDSILWAIFFLFKYFPISGFNQIRKILDSKI